MAWPTHTDLMHLLKTWCHDVRANDAAGSIWARRASLTAGAWHACNQREPSHAHTWRGSSRLARGRKRMCAWRQAGTDTAGRWARSSCRRSSRESLIPQSSFFGSLLNAFSVCDLERRDWTVCMCQVQVRNLKGADGGKMYNLLVAAEPHSQVTDSNTLTSFIFDHSHRKKSK